MKPVRAAGDQPDLVVDAEADRGEDPVAVFCGSSFEQHTLAIA
jgi:hypothetical protein